RPREATLALTIPVGADETWPVDASIGIVDGAADASYHLHLRDARERRVAEAAMARRLEHLSLLRALGESLGSDLRVQTAVERALDVCFARRGMGAIGALGAEETGILRAVASRGTAPAELARDVCERIRRVDLDDLHVPRRYSLVLPLS